MNHVVLQGRIESYLNGEDFYDGFVDYLHKQGWLEELDADEIEGIAANKCLGYFKDCCDNLRRNKSNSKELDFVKEVIGIILDNLEKEVDEKDGTVGYYIHNGMYSYKAITKYAELERSKGIDLAVKEFKREGYYLSDFRNIFYYGENVNAVFSKTKKYTTELETMKTDVSLPLKVFIEENRPVVNLVMYNLSHENPDYNDSLDGIGCHGVNAEEWDNCVCYQFKIDSLQGNILSKLTYTGKYNPYC
jgi:hypothetical protein